MSVANLTALGVFSSVRIQLGTDPNVPSLDAQGQLPVLIEVTERPLHTVRVSGGYSTDLVQAQTVVPNQHQIPYVGGGGAASERSPARQQIVTRITAWGYVPGLPSSESPVSPPESGNCCANNAVKAGASGRNPPSACQM